MLSKEEIEDLKRLFYTNRLTQYGKRKLIANYEEQIQNQQNKLDQLETNNKNLIEKLKNKQMKLLKQMQEPNNDRWKKDYERYYEEIKIQYKFLKEILEIVKGEK